MDGSVSTDDSFADYVAENPAQYVIHGTKVIDLSQADEQKMKLSAKNLFKKLSDNRNDLLVVDCYKDEQPKAKVKSAIQVSLNEDLPESYDVGSLRSEIDLLMNISLIWLCRDTDGLQQRRKKTDR